MRFPLLCSLLLLSVAKSHGQPPWFFAVASDPQFGMYTKNQGFAQETANFEFAVANVNRLHPRFMVVCGDLTNRSGDLNQIAEYKRILKQVAPDIPVYSVPGNHDVGDVPTPKTLQAFHDNIGPDYYTFTAENILGVVLDSNLIRGPERAPEAAERQKQWLIKTLQDAKSNPRTQILVFQHVPYFLENPDEDDGYFNIPKSTRREYLDLLEHAGVKYVFAGHYHRNAGGTDGPLVEVVTGAVGMPLGHSLSGFRIVTVQQETLKAPWFCFGAIPNKIELQNPSAIPCAQ